MPPKEGGILTVNVSMALYNIEHNFYSQPIQTKHVFIYVQRCLYYSLSVMKNNKNQVVIKLTLITTLQILISYTASLKLNSFLSNVFKQNQYI